MVSLDDTQTDHRPWPLPSAPWVGFMRWHDLLFAHWPVSVKELRPLIPAALKVDTWHNQAWLGIVPFRMTDVGPRLTPALPGLSAFPEINVRTYVTIDGKPGVWFFSLDATEAFAVRAARWTIELPYYDAEITCRRDKDDWINYQSYRIHREESLAAFSARYRPTDPVHEPEAGTLEHWLVERYCLYSATSSGNLWRLEIHHNPWPLQAAEAEITVNTMAKPLGIALAEGPTKLHFAERQDVFAWLPEKIGGAT